MTERRQCMLYDCCINKSERCKVEKHIDREVVEAHIRSRTLLDGGTENVGMETAGLENAGPNFTRVENAGPPSMEREMDMYKCIGLMYR